MSMQVFFNRSDCPDNAMLTRINKQLGTWTIDAYGMRLIARSNDQGRTFWFDVSSRTEIQMSQLKLIIAMRIPFHCN